MKKISLNKFLCLMLIFVFFVGVFTPIHALALETQDSMSVHAHIEAPAEETTSPPQADVRPIPPKTGDNSGLIIWLFLLLLSSVMLIVTVVYGKSKNIFRIKT